MVAHRWLTHIEKRRKITHILLSLRKHPNNSNPGSVSQGLKSVGQEGESLLRLQSLSQLGSWKSI
jgi:hypothetical protein